LQDGAPACDAVVTPKVMAAATTATPTVKLRKNPLVIWFLPKESALFSRRGRLPFHSPFPLSQTRLTD
jgi:hypothetical protein